MIRYILISCLICLIYNAKAQNVVLITLDGVRWQEVFTGIDKELMEDKEYSKKSKLIKEKFWSDNEVGRTEKLTPFISHYIKNNGSLIGDRRKRSKMSVANSWYFSYPGYSEIYTGVVDNTIDSNKPFNNPNVTFLEWLNIKSEFKDKMGVFGSWDLYPYIFNVERSKLHVNAGFTFAHGYEISEEAVTLNKIQKEIPSPWHNVRHDSFTYRFAKDYLSVVKPRVLVIAFGETDDFAHEGKYDEYILALNRTDKMISELWKYIQSLPEYANNTNLVITTDHGRGSDSANWMHHASKDAVKGYLKGIQKFPNGIVGSENIWLAALGSNIKRQGLIQSDKEFKQVQIASTLLYLLSEQSNRFKEPVLEEVVDLPMKTLK